MFNTYFSANNIIEKGAIFNLILSDRSDGKTFDCKYRALQNYDKYGYTTIYLRRYKTEITQKMYDTFMNEVVNLDKNKYYKDKYNFKGSKAGIEIINKETKEEGWLFYFVPLSMSGKLKSQIDIKNIREIDYDEFIPLDGRYIKDEISILLEFYKSIDRDRDSTRLLMFGNKIDMFNPMFDYFDINLDIKKDKIRLYKNGTLAVQIYSNIEHREERAKSKFSELVKNSKYENYNNGEILNALNIKIGSTDGLNYLYSFKTQNGEGSIWANNEQIVISSKQRKDGILLVDKIYNTGRQEIMITFGSYASLFKSAYKTGRLYFDNQITFHNFEDIIKKIGGI